MPHSRMRAPRFDQADRDWKFENAANKMIAETNFLDLDEPEEMPELVYQKMLYDFEMNGVENTKRNREMFLETQQLNQELKEFGITPERVAPTRDGRGHVRVSFDDMFKLLDLIPEQKMLAEKGDDNG